MKKILTTISLALTLCLSLTTVFAAPSINKNGNVKIDSLLINGQKAEGKHAAFSNNYQEPGVSNDVIDLIEKVNTNPSQLVSLIKDVDVSDYSLLTEIQDLSVYDETSKQLQPKQNNVTVTWEAPNLVKTLKSVKVLHYSTVRNTWEILTPKSIDFEDKTITQEFKDLSPVAVIYKSKDTNKEATIKTGDTTNYLPIILLGTFSIVGIGVFRRKIKE